ncbi:MAG: hypothetical protein AYK19_03915 [Theionarchaea archaeon DG-70-1]|nr:MAG: hypothetical protein AYK19_03915 [Theionarchaea archaeon DG-70-1]
MDEEEAVQFLKEFREKIDKYLFLGYSPPDSYFGGEGSKKIRKALKDPEFQHLCDVMMDMEPRVLNILEECGFKRYITLPYYGQDAFIKFTLFELVWRNYTPYNIRKEFFLGKIDKAIKILQKRDTEGVIFVVPRSTKVYEAIEDVADERQLTVKAADPHLKNKEILQLIELSEFIIVDLTVPNPNVYFEAGYAQAVGDSLIYIAEKGTDIDFGFTEYPIIFFETKYDLRRKMCERLDKLKREKRTSNHLSDLDMSPWPQYIV